jgi:hypothetical protein
VWRIGRRPAGCICRADADQGGQTRTETELPVLTMVTGYARWASGLLVPTRRAEDLYAGWWRLLHQLGVRWRVGLRPMLRAAADGSGGLLHRPPTQNVRQVSDDTAAAARLWSISAA